MLYYIALSFVILESYKYLKDYIEWVDKMEHSRKIHERNINNYSYLKC